jgi:hypothetical protein
VLDSDLVPAKLIYSDREGETYAVKPNPSHQWYFKYAQRPDEPLFIKCYDSINDGRARRIPHTAFVNPAHENDLPRESKEVRTPVFYDYLVCLKLVGFNSLRRDYHHSFSEGFNDYSWRHLQRLPSVFAVTLRRIIFVHAECRPGSAVV